MHWWQAVEGARALAEVPDVTDLTHDSRRAGPGVAFAAMPGARTDGHDHIEAAVNAGAPAIVVQAGREAAWRRFQGRVPLVVVPDTRDALGPLAAAVHGRPAESLLLVGVTGTDGKTTTAHLAAHVLDACLPARRCGYLTSVAFDTGAGQELNRSHMTTLEATLVQSLLGRAVAGGRGAMVVEASSEGLAQRRLAGCIFDCAVFTNLTRDHLDFHGSMEAYRAAKGRLFAMLDDANDKPYPRFAVLNAEDAASDYMRSLTHRPAVTYGFGYGVDYRALDARAEGFDMRFHLQAEGAEHDARVPLIGRFNVLNALAALAVAQGQGASLADAVAALASFPGVPGRLEVIDAGQPFRVYVDIASTPAALENVLTALRPATKGRLWVVFGAAGGRDPARRAGMGDVAGRLADRCVLTSEDPRDEDPDVIIETIAAALERHDRRDGIDYARRPDRREAIAYAFAHAEPGDTVLLAGKATEPTMVVKGVEHPWDERAVTRDLLA